MAFATLRNVFESSLDITPLTSTIDGIKFLKIRSLTKQDIISILQNLDVCITSKNEWYLRELLFSNVSSHYLSEYIHIERKRLHSIPLDFINPRCEMIIKPSVYMDNFNANINKYVRDTTITNMSILSEVLEAKLIPQLRNYVKWQWINQKCSDAIESIINKSDNVLPTLRKVPYVDFFLKRNGKEIPFDLKVTHFPKEILKARKIKIYEDLQAPLHETPTEIFRWLYEEQNPRLFVNNNRFFVILVDKQDLHNSCNLKSDISMISSLITTAIENIDSLEMHEIRYTYTKDQKVPKTYNALCMGVFIIK
jgi:hypothetical protein